MPRLPIATSQQTITQKSPNIKVDPSSFGARGRAIEKVGAVISETAKKFKDLQNLEEYTSSMTFAKKEMQDIQVKAENDEDIYTIHQRYSQEIQKVKDRALERISDRETQIRFGAELDAMVLTSDFKVRSIARSKQIDRARGTLLNDIDQSKRDYYNAATPLDRKILQDQVHNRLSEFARLGVINEEAATKHRIAWDNEVRIGQVSYDASINPQMAKDNINAGVYKLNAKEKAEELDKIEKLIDKKEKEAEEALKEAQKENMNGAVKQYLTDTLTLDDVNELFITGKINLEQHKKLEEMVTRAVVVDPETEHGTYNDIKNMIANGEDSVKIQNKIAESIGKTLGKENAEELLDEVIADEEAFNRDAKANAILKIKSFGNKEILKDQPFEIAPATLTGKVQELEFLFNKRVAQEKAKGERIYEIADEVINGYIRSVDPEYKPDAGKGEKVRLLKEGQTAVNLKTGEKIMVQGGRWVNVN